MRRPKNILTPFYILTVGMALLNVTGCSTSKNTARSRFWQAFTARYNTYYNGAVAYIDGSLEKEAGNKDNFTDIIPLYTVGNKASIDLGKTNFERAITKSEKAIHQHSITRRPTWNKSRGKTAKDIEWLSRREYNPFLWKVWMLMGRSQFYKGSFEDAASTFSYMCRLYSTQPAIYGKAMAWLAKCYIEAGWMYDAENVIRDTRRDSIDWHAEKEWDYTFADYYIHAKQYEQAIPYLRKVIKHEMRRKQKAREWYLMGQLEAALGHKELAYKAFKRVIRQSPPYDVELNARVASTEIMPDGQPKNTIRKLRRMAASDKNKDYLDQVYYAIGNIYLSQGDTAQAISSYETGAGKSTKQGIEKGVLLLRLGNLYWQKEKFSDASRCYDQAIGLLDKDREDYEQLSNRSKILDKLVPFTEAVHMQDSLQSLAKMSEKDRNAAIDRVIDALRKREKEHRDSIAEAHSQEVQAQNGGTGLVSNTPTTNLAQNAKWYFYNPMAVMQGKTAFQNVWGKRENVDDWQRVNRTVVASMGYDGGLNDIGQDSISALEQYDDSVRNVKLPPSKDPHEREYYMEQIPFTPGQVLASNKILEDGLYNSGVIFKDELDNLRLGEKALRRLTDDYPDFEHMDDAYYHLFLLYSRLGEPEVASSYVRKLQSEYPGSQWTSILTDPYFEQNARYGTHLEDSLYTATYDAFKAGRFGEVAANTRVSATRFPQGDNRDKFIFIGGLSALNSGDADACLAAMKELLDKYPTSKLGEMAGMIVNGVNSGKHLRGGTFDLSDIWQRRSVVLNDSDSIQARTFSADRNISFTFMIAYSPDSVNENKLLFELARYNFTSFLVRNFDINITDDGGLHRMQVSGFRNYDEALQYARGVYQQNSITSLLAKARTIVISDANIELLGAQYSYDDYDKFYLKHFAPLKVSTYYLLTEPDGVVQEKRGEPTPEQIDKSLDNGDFNQNGIYILPEPTMGGGDNSVNQPQAGDNGITTPQENERQQPVETGTIVIPNEEITPRNNASDQGNEPATGGATVVTEEESQAEPQPVAPQQQATTPPQTPPQAPAPKPVPQQAQPVQRRDDTGIYFDDDTPQGGTPTDNTQQNGQTRQEQKQSSLDLEDEYYDLDGF